MYNLVPICLCNLCWLLHVIVLNTKMVGNYYTAHMLRTDTSLKQQICRLKVVGVEMMFAFQNVYVKMICFLLHAYLSMWRLVRFVLKTKTSLSVSTNLGYGLVQ